MTPTSDSPTETFIKLFAESRQALLQYIRRLRAPARRRKRSFRKRFFVPTGATASRSLRPGRFFFPRRAIWRQTRFVIDGAVERDTPVSSDELPVDAEYESPESGLLRMSGSGSAQQAIDRLPPQCRAAFTLRVFHECSCQGSRGPSGNLGEDCRETYFFARHTRNQSISESSLWRHEAALWVSCIDCRIRGHRARGQRLRLESTLTTHSRRPRAF